MGVQTGENRNTRGVADSIPEVKALKALGEENRMRVVLALQDRELCVCQIVELLGLAHSTVSKHMSILKEGKLVRSRKIGRWVYYRLCEKDCSGLPGSALRLILATATDTEQAVRDTKRLEDILKLDPGLLCERQRRC